MTTSQPSPPDLGPATYPINQWYVAALAGEVGRHLLERWVLGEPLVLYRTKAGAPVALDNRCVHRRYPLSRGALIGDDVQCGYHGFTYDCTGACVNIPGQNHIPWGARVARYPLVERWEWIWVWMGDPDLADENLLPDHRGWLRVLDDEWCSFAGEPLLLNAGFQLLNENLLDLSHVSFLHPDSIGTDAVASSSIETECDDRMVRVARRTPTAMSPPLFVQSMGLTGMIDRYQTAEFVPPGYHVTSLIATPAGDSSTTYQHRVSHMITPERESLTRYYWALSRSYAKDDNSVTEMMRKGIRTVFLQDVQALEAQETMLSQGEPLDFELSIKADAGALHARRLVDQLLGAAR